MSDILVLCYHAVSDRWPDSLAVRPDAFARQVEHLLGRGYRAAPFSRAITDPPAARTFAVTFDDGYSSVAELAFPILARLEVPATVFVPTAHVGGEGPMAWSGIDHWLDTPHRDELVGLSWAQITELADAGWEIGSHTCTHPHLPLLDDAALERELVASRRLIEEHLGRPCQALAYPYGDADDRVVATAARVGYTTGAALPPRLPWRAERLQWPRTMIARDETDGAYRRHVSRSFRMLQASPAWGAARRIAARRRRAGT